jgi:serine/threonine protein kinase
MNVRTKSSFMRKRAVYSETNDDGAAIASRFLREIEIAARLTHPHLLPLRDSGVIDDQLYYVMPSTRCCRAIELCGQ